MRSVSEYRLFIIRKARWEQKPFQTDSLSGKLLLYFPVIPNLHSQLANSHCTDCSNSQITLLAEPVPTTRPKIVERVPRSVKAIYATPAPIRMRNSPCCQGKNLPGLVSSQLHWTARDGHSWAISGCQISCKHSALLSRLGVSQTHKMERAFTYEKDTAMRIHSRARIRRGETGTFGIPLEYFELKGTELTVTQCSGNIPQYLQLEQLELCGQYWGKNSEHATGHPTHQPKFAFYATFSPNFSSSQACVSLHCDIKQLTAHDLVCTGPRQRSTWLHKY